MPDLRIEVLVETGTYEGGWTRAAEAEAQGETEEELRESAFLAARTLWDEAYTTIQGCQRRVTFTTYGPECPDGDVVRTQTRP